MSGPARTEVSCESLITVPDCMERVVMSAWMVKGTQVKRNCQGMLQASCESFKN
jgi:hypothetical protein